MQYIYLFVIHGYGPDGLHGEAVMMHVLAGGDARFRHIRDEWVEERHFFPGRSRASEGVSGRRLSRACSVGRISVDIIAGRENPGAVGHLMEREKGFKPNRRGLT